MNRRLLAILFSVLALFLVMGCSGGDDSSSDDSAQPAAPEGEDAPAPTGGSGI